MNDITPEEITWILEKAGHPFKVNLYPNCTTVEIPGREHAFMIEDFAIECPEYIKQILLQRAIEGVNKIWMFEIVQKRAVIEIYDNSGDILNEIYFNPLHETDSAKLDALRYIREQEMKG